MLIYLWIYMYTHRYIKTQRFSCRVYFTCQVYWTSPCPSLPICTPQHFTGSAPHSTFRHPIFSLSSDSQSLAIAPGGCSAQKFVLSWIFTIALQFTFTKINSPMWNFCNQQRDQNKQRGKQSCQRFSSHVNCTLEPAEKTATIPTVGPGLMLLPCSADAPLFIRSNAIKCIINF